MREIRDRDDQISYVVEKVLERLNVSSMSSPGLTGGSRKIEVDPRFRGDDTREDVLVSPLKYIPKSGLFDSIDEAVNSAIEAQKEWVLLPLEKRKEIIEKVREACRGEVENLARLAVEETGLGRVEDKIKKNLLVINKTPGAEDIEPIVFTGDDGMTLVEKAPYGVIGSITPCTNPTETIICNGIGMMAAGNSVVFNPHPLAKNVCAKIVDIMNRAIVENGGPHNLLACIHEPTIEKAQELMKHKKIRLLVVTGGPDVVRTAMNSGKKVIAAGPGNPPAVVDETADIEQAARDIVLGASLDNNIVCIAEKEIICVDSIADALKSAMKKQGAYELNPYQLKQLEKVILKDTQPNKAFIGKNASVILKEIEVSVSDDIRLVIVETPADHLFVTRELLMPVIPLVRVKDVHEAITLAKVVEHGFGHTAVMHSRSIDNLHTMARVIGTSIFVKNGPSFAGLGLGGEGYTSFTIASPTGEGLTSAKNFTRERRCVLKDRFRII